jgi:hypothetical protein
MTFDPDHDPDREHDALQRSQHWTSRGERHAALLALLAAPDPQGPLWPRWQLAMAACRSAAAVRDEVLAMGAAARLQTLQRLAALTAAEDDRSALRRAALDLLAGADGAAAPRLAWLRLLLLRRLLGPARLPRAAAGQQPLALLGVPVAQVTGWLAATWAGPEAQPPPSAVSARRTLRAALALRRLHPMQRPLLVKRWLDLAAHSGALAHADGAEALALACRLLDSPEPPALAEALACAPFVATAATPGASPAAGRRAAQLRSL